MAQRSAKIWADSGGPVTSELTLLVLRLGFLLLLWFFVFAIVYALRSDLFGQRVRKMSSTDATGAASAGGSHSSASPAPASQPVGGIPAFAAHAPVAQPLPVPPVSSMAPLLASAAVADPIAPALGGAFAREPATAQNAQRLVITSGAKVGAEFPLTRDEITIGRSSDSAIVIRDDYTSTHHARLMLWNDQWMLQDLDSTNGTFLDGERVAVPTQIPLNTPIKIGATSFELRR